MTTRELHRVAALLVVESLAIPDALHGQLYRRGQHSTFNCHCFLAYVWAGTCARKHVHCTWSRVDMANSANRFAWLTRPTRRTVMHILLASHPRLEMIAPSQLWKSRESRSHIETRRFCDIHGWACWCIPPLCLAPGIIIKEVWTCPCQKRIEKTPVPETVIAAAEWYNSTPKWNHNKTKTKPNRTQNEAKKIPKRHQNEPERW